MTTSTNYVIQYIPPTILRCGHYEFRLIYTEDEMELSFQGVGSGDESGGILHFPTHEQWDLKYPQWEGRRKRVKSNIIEYAKTIYDLSFLADFLLDENRIKTASRFEDVGEEEVQPLAPDEIASVIKHSDDGMLATQKVLSARQSTSISKIGLLISAVALILYMVVR